MARRPRIALLLVAASVALGAGCGDDEGDSTTAATVTSPETVVESTELTTSDQTTTEETTTEGGTPPADLEVTELTGFTSPTGNIGCVIDRRSVRCDISERDWEPPPKPAGCDLDFGQGISLDAGGPPAFICAGDTTLGAGEPLPYGQSIAAGLLRCESAESGMTCRDVETGRGFTISQQAYELL